MILYMVQYDQFILFFQCLAEPLKPQYDGGIIVNPEINDGLKGWTTHGGVKIEPRVSEKGNNFIVAHSRKHHNGSVSQKGFLLEKEKLYTFSGLYLIVTYYFIILCCVDYNYFIRFILLAILFNSHTPRYVRGEIHVRGKR